MSKVSNSRRSNLENYVFSHFILLCYPLYSDPNLSTTSNQRFTLIQDYPQTLTFLKGVFAKNERGYRLSAIKKAILIPTNLTTICC